MSNPSIEMPPVTEESIQQPLLLEWYPLAAEESIQQPLLLEWHPLAANEHPDERPEQPLLLEWFPGIGDDEEEQEQLALIQLSDLVHKPFNGQPEQAALAPVQLPALIPLSPPPINTFSTACEAFESIAQWSLKWGYATYIK